MVVKHICSESPSERRRICHDWGAPERPAVTRIERGTWSLSMVHWNASQATAVLAASGLLHSAYVVALPSQDFGYHYEWLSGDSSELVLIYLLTVFIHSICRGWGLWMCRHMKM